MRGTALGKRGFLKVGLRLINIQGASLLSLKSVAPIFHPVNLISQAELETCGCALEYNTRTCKLPGSSGGCRGHRGTVQVQGHNTVTSVVERSMHNKLENVGPSLISLIHYPSVCSGELCFILPCSVEVRAHGCFPGEKRPGPGHAGSPCWRRDVNCFSVGLAVLDGAE